VQEVVDALQGTRPPEGVRRRGKGSHTFTGFELREGSTQVVPLNSAGGSREDVTAVAELAEQLKESLRRTGPAPPPNDAVQPPASGSGPPPLLEKPETVRQNGGGGEGGSLGPGGPPAPPPPPPPPKDNGPLTIGVLSKGKDGLKIVRRIDGKAKNFGNCIL
jgi:hypothetical protein